MRQYLDVLITLTVAIFLTIAMLWPLEVPPQTPNGSDKIVHLFAFATLSLPLSLTGRFGLFLIFIGGSTFGGAIELLQPSFNRNADLYDWIADIAGIIIGIGCGFVYKYLSSK